jgi:hypothetical protein
VNTAHAQQLLAVMRFLKYWNRRTHDKPRLQPYYFETLVLNVFRPVRPINTHREAISYFFEMCKTNIWTACPDPKGLGRNLDQKVDTETKRKVSASMSTAATYAARALNLEANGNYKDAIGYWGLIFGPEFPKYG